MWKDEATNISDIIEQQFKGKIFITIIFLF